MELNVDFCRAPIFNPSLLMVGSAQVRPNLCHEPLKLLAPKKLTNLDTLPCLRNREYFFVLLRLR